MKIPKNVSKIMQTLQKHDFDAYIVGGCVRDSILGKSPKDWDITTNATPEQLRVALKNYRLIPTGEKYGTMTVLIEGDNFEVTTYRADGNYSDGRRPDEVRFSDNIRDDLCRRDFTINAMAFSEPTGLVDLFGGLSDLKNGIIRCVGDPIARFNEDALRIMRAIRFACRLDFELPKETIRAIWECGENLKNVSQERITAELVEILKFRKPDRLFEYIIKRTIPEFLTLAQVAHNNPYHYTDVFTHTIDALFHCKSEDIEVLLALLFHDIGKQEARTFDEKRLTNHYRGHPIVSETMTREILTRMRFDNNTIDNVCLLVKYHDWDLVPSKKAARKSLNKLGHELCLKLLEIKFSDRFAHRLKLSEYEIWAEKMDHFKVLWQEVLDNGEAFNLGDLAINGDDLLKIGFLPNKALGDTLKSCLDHVIDDPTKNNKTDLLEYIKNRGALPHTPLGASPQT
ncbi:MAG: HD domain-containing protein, partial [Turicibacter sp.]|nr:HD domain-containing protein [Turicibacter sp.]